MADNADKLDDGLVADAYPVARDLPGTEFFRRRWILRTGSDIPVGSALERAVKSFELEARDAIAVARGPIDSAGSSLAAVGAIRIDDHHLALVIDCPTPAASQGDEAAIATFTVLRAAGQLWQVEDIQGLPTRYWFWMR